MSEHFNSSLSQSAVQKWRCNQIVKQKIKLKITFTMTDGTGHRQSWASKTVTIRLSDVTKVYNHAYHKYEQSPTKLNLRNFVIIRVARKDGLRNSEIRTLEIERIDFQQRSFQVLDSKKHIYLPLPTDVLTLQFIKDLIDPRVKGYVFIHEGSWTQVKANQPLSRVELWQIVHDIALEVGIHGFNPRIFRQALAYEWYKEMRDNPNSKKTMKDLQQFLRHVNPKTTDIYMNKFYSFPDLQRAFDDDEGIQNSPLVPETAQASYKKMISHGDDSLKLKSPWVAGETICNGCGYVGFCKFAPLPQCASECRFKQTKEEELKKIG
jgi:integrase